MSINPTHYRTVILPYNPDADSSSSEEIYPDIDIEKQDGQGQSKPVPIPTKPIVPPTQLASPKIQRNEWSNQHFGD